MKVSLAKHGGHLAAMRIGRPPQVVDTDALPPAAAGQLARLLSAAKAAPAARNEERGPGGDVMSYTITVEEAGGETVLSQSDTTMSPAFAALLSWLEKHSAEK